MRARLRFCEWMKSKIESYSIIATSRTRSGNKTIVWKRHHVPIHMLLL